MYNGKDETLTSYRNKTEEHDSGFKETKGGDKCGFPLILFVNADVVVSPSNIKLGEQSGILHVIN